MDDDHKHACLTDLQLTKAGEVGTEVVDDAAARSRKCAPAHEQNAQHQEGQGRRHPHRLHVHTSTIRSTQHIAYTSQVKVTITTSPSQRHDQHIACTSQINVMIDTSPSRHKPRSRSTHHRHVTSQGHDRHIAVTSQVNVTITTSPARHKPTSRSTHLKIVTYPVSSQDSAVPSNLAKRTSTLEVRTLYPCERLTDVDPHIRAAYFAPTKE